MKYSNEDSSIDEDEKSNVPPKLEEQSEDTRSVVLRYKEKMEELNENAKSLTSETELNKWIGMYRIINSYKSDKWFQHLNGCPFGYGSNDRRFEPGKSHIFVMS